MKRALLCLLLASLCSIPPAAAAVAKEVQIQFKLNKVRLKHKPGFAAWIETKDGKNVTTVYSCKGFATWQKKHKDKELFKYWSKTDMNSAQPDAVTKATPWPGTKLSVTWDLRDAQGSRVPDGDYVLKFECVTENKDENAKFAQVTSLPFKIGGRLRKFSKSKTVHNDGRRTRKPAIYIRSLSLRVVK